MSEATGGIDMDDEGSGVVKKFMFVNRKAPYGTIYALEALEVVLISAAFEQDVRDGGYTGTVTVGEDLTTVEFGAAG